MLLVLDPLPLLQQYQSSRRDHPGTKGEGKDISVQLGQLSQASSKSPEIETLQSPVSIGFQNSLGVALHVVSTRVKPIYRLTSSSRPATTFTISGKVRALSSLMWNIYLRTTIIISVVTTEISL